MRLCTMLFKVFQDSILSLKNTQSDPAILLQEYLVLNIISLHG